MCVRSSGGGLLAAGGCDPAAVAGLYKLPAKKPPCETPRRANWQVSAADYDGLIWREERLGACTALARSLRRQRWLRTEV